MTRRSQHLVLPALRGLLLDLLFGLVSLLLLGLQRATYVRIRRWRWNFPGRRAGIRSTWQTPLARIVRERLKSGIELFCELVLHFLQVVDVDHYCRAHAAIPPLAAGDAHAHLVVIIRGVIETGNDIPRGEFAILTVDGCHSEIARHHKKTPSRIKCRRWRFGATRGRLLRSRRCALLFGCELRPNFLCNSLLHLRSDLTCVPLSLRAGPGRLVSLGRRIGFSIPLGIIGEPQVLS